MITVDRLYVRYDDTNILEDINLNLPTGITCAVIGPSGCGKSTLLNVLAGLQKNYQGLVQINGENPSPKKQTIGFIPQNYGLLPWLTVKENILLGLKIKKEAKQGLPQNLVDNLGLSNLLNRYPNDLLLMDEPFSALDAITREEMQDVFIDLWQKQKVSTILVTHYVEEALYLGQKIIVMTSAPGGIYKIIDNPLFSDKNFRDREIFSSLSKEIRNYLKKAGSKNER